MSLEAFFFFFFLMHTPSFWIIILNVQNYDPGDTRKPSVPKIGECLGTGRVPAASSSSPSTISECTLKGEALEVRMERR